MTERVSVKLVEEKKEKGLRPLGRMLIGFIKGALRGHSKIIGIIGWVTKKTRA